MSAVVIRMFADQIHTPRRKIIGMSPQQFLTAFRITKATELLQLTSLPIESIALSCGYHDPLVFTKAFKQMKKMSPALSASFFSSTVVPSAITDKKMPSWPLRRRSLESPKVLCSIISFTIPYSCSEASDQKTGCRTDNPMLLTYVNCCGLSQTEGLHSFGPALKPHYLVHYILSGKGRFSIGGKEYPLAWRALPVLLPGRKASAPRSSGMCF